MKTELTCADCGCKFTTMSLATLAKGSSVREPGEAICQSCTSSRVMLVREVAKIPADITLIQAKRMVRA